MKTFTEAEIKQLKLSPYVQNVFSDRIVYGEVFEREYHRLIGEGVNHFDAFELLGLDLDIVGRVRVKKYHYNYQKRLESNPKRAAQYNNQTVSEELDRLRNEVELLKQENEFLKKKRQIDTLIRNKKR